MFICVYYYSQKNTFGDISWKQVLKKYIQTTENKTPMKYRGHTQKKLFGFVVVFFYLDTCTEIKNQYYGIVAI